MSVLAAGSLSASARGGTRMCPNVSVILPKGPPSEPSAELERLWTAWEAQGRLQDGLLPTASIPDFLNHAGLNAASAPRAAMNAIGGAGVEHGLTLEQA